MIIDHTVLAIRLHLQPLLPLVHDGSLPFGCIRFRVSFPEAYCGGTVHVDDEHHGSVLMTSITVE
jgi:hypothetical protein